MNSDDYENLQEQDLNDTRTALLYFGGIAIVVLLLYSLYAASIPQSTQGTSQATAHVLSFPGIFGTLILISLAAFALGSILGFLFGIPKTASTPNSGIPPTTENSSSAASPHGKRFATNTNLEEMSDWLTKIIIGAGLVGIKDIAEYFSTVIGQLSSTMPQAPFVSAVIGSTILFSLILGFFSIYLMTRLFLARAFDNVEALLQTSERKEKEVANLDFSTLSKDEQKVLKTVLDANGRYTLPNTFQRESSEHQALRSLKTRLLIQNVQSGKWEPGKTAQLTALAELLKDRINRAITAED